MSTGLPIEVKTKPVLDPGFMPALLWTRAYEARVSETGGGSPVSIALQRPDGTSFVHRINVLPHEGPNVALNRKYVERFVKFLLWHQGGNRVIIGGSDAIAATIASIYAEGGEREFDYNIVGTKMFRSPIAVESRSLAEMPEAKAATVSLGRHLDGCRIGFDLGGSDRKCAAVIDGDVVFSEEIEWNPYFQSDPQYHFDGIDDTLRRAAEKLPRVDAIGGSAAGDYANNEVLVASLFRGISDADFEQHIRRIFWRLKEKWGNVPFEVANDGEVTALAGSMSLNDNAVLGISMGTSQAAGYCDGDGHITCWLNELAFVPVDYRDEAPADEWSGDIGCGVQYFSQQAVARLAPKAGIELPEDMPFADRLKEVQTLMRNGDERARRIYETIGVYFGYTIPWYARFYEIRNLLILGRVTSGEGGQVIVDKAKDVLADEFPELAESIKMTTPDEKFKRHGQAIAAASLPSLAAKGA
jgi:predicted NBD/HSP70 family sugar kinase